jgi:hypothetical protein
MFKVFVVTSSSDPIHLNQALAAGGNVESQHALVDCVVFLVWIPPA